MSQAQGVLEGLVDMAVQRALLAFQSAPPARRLLDITAASEYLGITEDALRSKSANGILPTVKIDRRLRFDIKDLDALVDRSKYER